MVPGRWMLDRPCLLASGSALLFQPGVDVGAPVARGPADLNERRPGAFLPPALQGPDAHLELVGELLLGEERSCHGTPGRRPADSARPRRHSSPTDEQ
jgi:hypothetical protein